MTGMTACAASSGGGAGAFDERVMAPANSIENAETHSEILSNRLFLNGLDGLILHSPPPTASSSDPVHSRHWS
jgi:hypothetical protein